jgi:serine/threonine protein kinase
MWNAKKRQAEDTQTHWHQRYTDPKTGLPRTRTFAKCGRGVLGEGSFGKAVQVECWQNNKYKPYCLKEVAYDRHETVEDVEKRMDEIRCMQKMRDQINVVHLYYHWHDRASRKIYMVMTLCKEDLREQIERRRSQHNGRYSGGEMTRYMVDLLGALDWIHNSLKMMHRDIKPENVLCDEEYRPLLSDFGCTKMMQSDLTCTYAGSPLFMAPEQHHQQAYSNKVDVWSLGCVFYEMATFENPYEAEAKSNKIIVLIHRITSAPPDMQRVRARYPSGHAEAIEWMMRMNPRERASADEVLNLFALPRKLPAWAAPKELPPIPRLTPSEVVQHVAARAIQKSFRASSAAFKDTRGAPDATMRVRKEASAAPAAWGGGDAGGTVHLRDVPDDTAKLTRQRGHDGCAVEARLAERNDDARRKMQLDAARKLQKGVRNSLTRRVPRPSPQPLPVRPAPLPPPVSRRGVAPAPAPAVFRYRDRPSNVPPPKAGWR